MTFFVLLVCLNSHTATYASPSIEVVRYKPYNLFEPTENVAFNIRYKELPAGIEEAKGVLKDYSGKVVWSGKVPLSAGTSTSAALAAVDLGRLQRGYYELLLVADEKYEAKATFGVIESVHRTAAQVRDGGFVFGIKWWGGVNNPREGVEALDRLGLQWTRIIQNQSSGITTKEMLTDYPMNAVIKIERFPRELYDTERYGPIEEWDKKYGKGSWILKTLPRKAPYQEYLRQQLRENIPPNQNIFEIWNEPWDKMPPEDFAALSQWVAEVVLKERPKAIIGPNLGGSTSPYEYDARVIKAGGLKGMNMVALHPYGSATDRAWFRNYKQWLKQQTGKDIEIYITEYGSHSTPAGPNQRSESEQARLITLQSLSLYAEGVKALIPHWLGQTETDPKYLEDWFGFVRKNENPKPALIAHANTARLIDGSRYIGDLWYGPQIGAMLFDNKGTNVLAVWTGAQTASADPANNPEIEIKTGAKEITIVDIVGKEQKQTPRNGKLKLKLSKSPQYVIGISPKLARKASKELRPDRWPEPSKPERLTRVGQKFKTAPILDGNFDDWEGMPQLGLLNPKVSGADASGTGYVGWDEQFLYIGVDMRDNEMFNNRPRAKLYQGDSIELFLSTEPRQSGSGFSPRDYQILLTPNSSEGKPVLGVVTDREAGIVTDINDSRIFAGLTKKADSGWAIEAAIPWSALRDFSPANGAKLALEMRVNDTDTSHERFKIDPSDRTIALSVTDPSNWSLMVLKD